MTKKKKVRPKRRYKKRYAGNGKRNYKDPRYIEFRRRIRERDSCICQICGIKKPPRWIQVHHILCWSTHPHLRYNENNGVCLCAKCHKGIKGKEMHYVKFFAAKVRKNKK